MTDTVEKVAERLAALEKTVAEGFHGNTRRFEGADARFDSIDRRFDSIDRRFESIDARFTALEHKLDVSVESLRGDMQTVVEVLTAFTDEMRRTTASLRKEGAADRELLKLALQEHGRRIHALERRATSSSA